MKIHDAIEHALSAVNGVRKTHNLTDDQARNVITVEVTHKGLDEIIHWSDDYHRRHASPEFGPVKIMGIRFYTVHRLPDGDTWRVLNALGVR